MNRHKTRWQKCIELWNIKHKLHIMYKDQILKVYVF